VKHESPCRGRAKGAAKGTHEASSGHEGADPDEHGRLLGTALVLTGRVTTLWQYYLGFEVLGAAGIACIQIPAAAIVSRRFVRSRGAGDRSTLNVQPPLHRVRRRRVPGAWSGGVEEATHPYRVGRSGIGERCMTRRASVRPNGSSE
jgi:hypothetical protein